MSMGLPLPFTNRSMGLIFSKYCFAFESLRKTKQKIKKKEKKKKVNKRREMREKGKEIELVCLSTTNNSDAKRINIIFVNFLQE